MGGRGQRSALLGRLPSGGSSREYRMQSVFEQVNLAAHFLIREDVTIVRKADPSVLQM